MKRAGNLYPAICAPENLRLAFYKAAKGRSDRTDINQFRQHLDHNLNKLRQQLMTENCDVGNYHYFRIRDPKPRHICAAAFPERVLHHAIMNICEPVLDRYAIFDSYACRKNKGSVRALKRAQYFMSNTTWYLKLDIRRYFDLIDHDIMQQLIRRRLKDKAVLHLFSQIVTSYHTRPNKGLPIGNLISQHLSNLYLGHFDHWVKEALRTKYYVRYMDDFVLFAKTKSELKQQLESIQTFLESQLGLSLKHTTQLNRVRFGLPFLGFRVYPTTLKLGERAKTRFRVKLQRYEQKYLQGYWAEGDLVQHIEPMLGFMQIAASKGFRKSVINRYGVLS